MESPPAFKRPVARRKPPSFLAAVLLISPFLLYAGHNIDHQRITAVSSAEPDSEHGGSPLPVADTVEHDLPVALRSTRFATLPASCEGSVVSSIFGAIYATGRDWAGSQPIAERKPAFFYENNMPPSRARNSLSGPGSFTGYATKKSLQFLVDVINEHDIKTMLDIPCGDVNWQMGAWEVDSLEQYTGADVAMSVIDLNKQRFHHHSNKMFVFHDFVACPIPLLVDRQNGTTEPYELLHVRDVLQHLSLRHGKQAAAHILSSGARFLIATTYPSETNANVRDGGWFWANLELEPFNFPKPVQCVQTHPRHEADSTCLYDLRPLHKGRR